MVDEHENVEMGTIISGNNEISARECSAICLHDFRLSPINMYTKCIYIKFELRNPIMDG